MARTAEVDEAAAYLRSHLVLEPKLILNLFPRKTTKRQLSHACKLMLCSPS